MSELVLEMRQITKEFPGLRALDQVSLQVRSGEIHALVGANGAGKSTLMKILSGFYPHGTYEGEILLNGEPRRFSSIRDSEEAGIAIIYQELTLVRSMTVAENIYLGKEICHAPGVIDWNATYRDTARVLHEVGLRIQPAARVLDLGVGSQQLVEIAKALARDQTLLILDEPTAALTETETDNLLAILASLRSKGVSCIYISHRLNEVLRIADRITVLRDGRTITTDEASGMTVDRIIRNMVGRDLTHMHPRKERALGETLIEVRNWTIRDLLTRAVVCKDMSFEARRGEILGIAGLMGAGRTELVMSLFGVWGDKQSGELLIDGARVTIRSAHEAIEAGLALVSEDRKRYGLVLGMDIKQNATLASLEKLSRLGVIDANEEIRATDAYVGSLHIKTPSLEHKAGNLSGGNQQKVVIAKWLLTAPKVLFLDEPTRGIDVGAKVEIYNIMNDLVDQGMCVIMISSELPEVLGMSDRILVVHEGRIAANLQRDEASEERVMYFATGGK